MFLKKNIHDIPIEDTPHASGARKLLVNKTDTTSAYFEAYTYGYLSPREKFSMHKHNNIIEICLVVKGSGLIKDNQGNRETYQKGDRFIFPSNTEHEIDNSSDETSEFYFIRVQDQ